jgi:hypothetical protein
VKTLKFRRQLVEIPAEESLPYLSFRARVTSDLVVSGDEVDFHSLVERREMVLHLARCAHTHLQPVAHFCFLLLQLCIRQLKSRCRIAMAQGAARGTDWSLKVVI